MQKFATYAGLWTHLPIEERIATIAEAGFDAVCLDFEREMARTEGPWEEQMRLADKYHLPVENVHLSGEGMTAVWAEGDAGERVTERLIAELRDMASLGVKVGVAHVTWGHGFPEGTYEQGLVRYERAVEAAEKYGVTLALENSVFPRHVHYLLSHIKSPSLGFCYDSGHENAFTPNEDYLSQYADIVVALHLHDNDGKIDNHWVPFHPLGTVNWTKKAEQLKKTELFRRMVTLEANPEGDNLLDAFRAALASAKKLAAL